MSGAGGDNDDGDEDEEPLLEPEKVLKNDLDTDLVVYELADDSKYY